MPKQQLSKTIKKGTRKNKQLIIQKYQCKNCSTFFTLNQIKHTTYPAKIILNAISHYNLGHTQEDAAKLINQKYKIKAQRRTISDWLNQYKSICTYSRLRKNAIKQYSPKDIIQKQTLNHIQPYTFKYHKAKLDILLKENPQFAALKNYIEKINSKTFPHNIFTYHQENPKNNRASQADFKYLDVRINKRENFSNKLQN